MVCGSRFSRPLGLILSIGGAGSDVALWAREHGDINAGFDYRDPRLAAKNGDTLMERSHEQHRGHAIRGMIASLVFDKLFFPKQSAYVGTMLALTTFAVGFLTRPLGAAVFGHYGDRLGRKTMLTFTLMLTGVSTFAIGLVPTYDRAGMWAAVLLVALRLLQGFGLGGEWGGSVLVSIEWDHFDRWRGFFASWPQFGVPAGLLLASGMLSITNHAMSSASFSAWGWRIPFLASVVLIGVGLYVRLGLLETPAFARLRDQNQIAKMPVFEVLRENWREVILTCLIRSAETGPFYIFTTFILTYGTRTLGLERAALLNFVTIASVVALFDIPLWGYVSDRIGRKRMYLIGAIALFLFAYPYYVLLDTRTPALVAVAIIISIVIHDMMYGPQAAFIAESFPTRLRYSGASLGYQLAAIVSGGPAPMIASYLMHRYGTSSAISVYLMVLGTVTIAATIMLKERSGAEEPAIGIEVAAAGASR